MTGSASIPASSSSLPVLADTVAVDTPELVTISYTVAGVGSRAAAAILDYLLATLALVGILLLLAVLRGPRLLSNSHHGTASQAWALSILVFAQFVVLWGYYVLFEALNDGQTPGKRIERLRVVRDGGYSVDFTASAVRNLIRIIDMQPVVSYAVGIIAVSVSRSGKRLGDMVAGTIVVREAIVPRRAAPVAQESVPDAAEPAAIEARLTDEEFAVLERFMERRGSLDADRRATFAARLAERLTRALPPEAAGNDAARLVRLYESERQARARGTAGRAARGAARERHAIVAAGSARWDEFAARLARAQRGGLRVLGESGVREFVAAYRDMAADLARLQTATRGSTEPELFYLGRLVAGGHNLLYRTRRMTLARAVRFLVVDAPREVRRSAGPILLAAFLMFAPAVIAYTAVVRHPEVARTFIPESMLERAQEGVSRAREGTGYIPDPQVFRPVMASSIIANNVQVTFAAFAGGITAGVLTVWLLIVNGVSIGGIFGLYASKGILPLLLAFVAPHGVLELTAISIGGGAGLLVASGLFLPGLRTRRVALVENGLRAIRLVGAAMVLLVVAGSLEGFVSPIPWWPLQAKLAVSGLTVVALYVYLRGPGEPRREAPTSEQPEAIGHESDARLLGLRAPPAS